MVNWGKLGSKTRPLIPTEENEQWIRLASVVPEIQDYYFFSNNGRIYNFYNGHLLRPAIDSKGYPYYHLAIKNVIKGKNYRIHRLIQLCFYPTENPDNLIVHHKDSDKTNFDPSNLVWLTHSDHAYESYKLGEINNLQGEDRSIANITNDQAREICRRIASGEVMYKIADEMNVSRDTVYSISSHKAWNSISKDYDFSNKNKTKRYNKNKQ